MPGSPYAGWGYIYGQGYVPPPGTALRRGESRAERTRLQNLVTQDISRAESGRSFGTIPSFAGPAPFQIQETMRVPGQYPPNAGIPGSGTTIDQLFDLAKRWGDRILFGNQAQPQLPAPVGVQDPDRPVRDLPMVPAWMDRWLSGTLPRGARRPFTGPNGIPECPKGYHFHKSGAPWCVRNRRMNPLNRRALNRAGRRVGGFVRTVKDQRKLKKAVKGL